MTDFDAIILADGEFPVATEPLILLRKASFVCACDGAAVHYPIADVIIGDGDSVPEIFRNRLVQVDEQEDNDLTKATRYCVSKSFRFELSFFFSNCGSSKIRKEYILSCNCSPFIILSWSYWVA